MGLFGENTGLIYVENCPRCDKELEIEEWEAGECPECGCEYYWEECGYGSDCGHAYIEFDKSVVKQEWLEKQKDLEESP